MTRLTRKSYMGFSPTFTRERSIFAAEKNSFSIIRSQELPRNRRVKRSVDCVHYISILECVFVLNGKATERKSHWKNRPSSLKNASRTPGRLALPVRTWLPFHLLNAQEGANNPPPSLHRILSQFSLLGSGAPQLSSSDFALPGVWPQSFVSTMPFHALSLQQGSTMLASWSLHSC